MRGLKQHDWLSLCFAMCLLFQVELGPCKNECVWTIKINLTGINVNRGRCRFLIFLLHQLITDATSEAKTKVYLKLYGN